MSPSCSNIQVALYGGWKKEDPDTRFGQLELNSNLICQVNTYKSQTLIGQCDVMSPINSETAYHFLEGYSKPSFTGVLCQFSSNLEKKIFLNVLRQGNC